MRGWEEEEKVFVEVVSFREMVSEEVKATLALVSPGTVIIPYTAGCIHLFHTFLITVLLMFAEPGVASVFRCVYCSGVNAASRTGLRDGTQECAVTLLV